MQEIKIDNDTPNVSIITLPKNVLGGNDALEFSETVSKLCSENKKAIIVDLALVEVMNSSGLGMLVAALSKTRKQQIKLFLIAVPEKVNSLLKITHLDELFAVHSDRQSALDSL